jgi:hypothetical protein
MKLLPSEEEEPSFFEKRSKNFGESGLALSGKAEASRIKRFAAFFQKRSPCFPSWLAGASVCAIAAKD